MGTESHAYPCGSAKGAELNTSQPRASGSWYLKKLLLTLRGKGAATPPLRQPPSQPCPGSGWRITNPQTKEEVAWLLSLLSMYDPFPGFQIPSSTLECIGAQTLFQRIRVQCPASTGGSYAFFWPPWVLRACGMQTYMLAKHPPIHT